MPVCKNLHVAKDLEALQKMANLDTKKIDTSATKQLCNSATKILEEAEKNQKLRDEEMAFIYYFKFLDLVMYLKKRRDFMDTPLSKFLSESASSALDKAVDLKSSLTDRYKAVVEAEQEKEKEMERLQVSVKHLEDKISAKTAPKASAPIIENISDISVSPSGLYSLMMDPKTSFLIFDVRNGEDFEESHIKHNSCINIPQDVLVPGTTFDKLMTQLPVFTASQLSRKNAVNHVIIIDWSTKVTVLPQTHPIQVLTDALVKWDSKDPLRRPPQVVIGGYKEWLIKYPMHTTKALDILGTEFIMNKVEIADVSEVYYPDLDKPLIDELGQNTLNNNREALSIQKVNNWMQEQKPSIDRSVKPIPTPTRSVSVNKNGSINTPEYNRNLKPSWASKSETLAEALQKEEIAAKETLSATEEEFKKEQEFAQLRLRKELEAEESKREELQKQEELLRESLRQLQKKNQEQEQQYLAIKAENVEMKKLLRQQSNDEQEREKEKDIQILASKKEDLQKEVERLRRERKLKEKKEAEAKGLFRVDSQKSQPELIKQHQSGDYTVQLQDSQSNTDGLSRGLSRSYSSPNIAQMTVNEQFLENQKKMPLIDRTLKPRRELVFRPGAVEISTAKVRNLNPIYGQIPSRAATGLRNLGNTCYMNSTIQCLSNTVILSSYFIYDYYKDDIRRNSKHGTHGEIVEDFAIIIKALWAGQYRSFSPRDFKNTASKYIPMCIGSEQQDSHEFLIVLMDKLHGDLNQGQNLDPLTNLESLGDHEATEMFWKHHKDQNRSQMSDTFEGLLKSTLKCLSCQKTSNSFEVFCCLSVPISTSKCSLNDSLATFLQPERMSGEGAWDCPNCRQKKEAEKRLTICKYPEVLIIHLKRFSYEGMWRKKIQSLVTFSSELIRGGKTYQLYGVVNHFGYLEGGHYTAYCKNLNGKWFKFDDHEVSEVSSSDIMTAAAYVLFYSCVDSRK